MAGMGTRFSSAGYKDIKPLIPIHGRPMIAHVIDSVGIEGNWVFIVQREHREQHNLDEILEGLRPGCTIVEVDGVTEGAACSVLLAEKAINMSTPLIIINSDNIIDWDQQEFYDAMDDGLDGLILCFYDTDPKWSFAQPDVNGIVMRVAEKDPISNFATAGLYIWSTGARFVTAARAMIRKNIRVNGEFYICPVYNENILESQVIGIAMVREMNGVGTPEDLESYLRA